MKASSQEMLDKALKVDIICFQRPTGKNALELAKLLKLKGKKIIFDNDDSYSGIPLNRLGSEKQVKIAQELNKNLNEFVTIADGVTVSTEILAKEYTQLNPNVVVLKNCIDPLDEYPCKPNTTGKFRVGFIGSVTSNDDYFHIKDQIKKLDERGDITLVIMGVKYADGSIMPSMQEDFDFWNSLNNVEWHSVVPITEYYSTVARLALDLAIIPRKDHYFNKCKSNLKFLDMSLHCIPVLAQGFSDGLSPYQGVDEKYMTIVNDNDKWLEYITHIKNNHKLYKDMASKAREYVLENYNIKTYAQTWVDEIIKLTK
jgi:glycosyltransferase involved in cell wall biosynthesis